MLNTSQQESGKPLEPLVICAAITGGGPPKGRTPYHPVTAQDIAKEACAAWRAGAAIVHCHARDSDGAGTNDLATYRDLLARIRDLGCEAVINFSAGDCGGRSPHAERLRVIESGADIVSLAGGSFNIGARVYDNAPAFRAEMARRMQHQGVTPEFELFDLGQVHGLMWLREQGLLPARPMVTLGFGVQGTLPGEPAVLDAVLQQLPANVHWSAAGNSLDFETFRLLMVHAFSLGGGVRTGMEDIVQVRPGVLAKSNAELVAQWTEMAAIWGRPVATSAHVREHLLVARPSHQGTST
jgi:3-keto-5-aminohexanoate cleavage enzyme